MILKKIGNINGSVDQKKNLFILDIEDNAVKIMITQEKGKPIYLLSKDPEMRLYHCRFAHASNAHIVQAPKLVNGMNLLDANIGNSNNDRFFSNSKKDDRKRYEPDVFNSVPLNKITESIKNLCDMCIKNKYTRIIKYKAMTLIAQ